MSMHTQFDPATGQVVITYAGRDQLTLIDGVKSIEAVNKNHVRLLFADGKVQNWGQYGLIPQSANATQVQVPQEPAPAPVPRKLHFTFDEDKGRIHQFVSWHEVEERNVSFDLPIVSVNITGGVCRAITKYKDEITYGKPTGRAVAEREGVQVVPSNGRFLSCWFSPESGNLSIGRNEEGEFQEYRADSLTITDGVCRVVALDGTVNEYGRVPMAKAEANSFPAHTKESTRQVIADYLGRPGTSPVVSPGLAPQLPKQSTDKPANPSSTPTRKPAPQAAGRQLSKVDKDFLDYFSRDDEERMGSAEESVELGQDVSDFLSRAGNPGEDEEE